MYDGQSSKDFGVFIASTDTGLFKENFLPERNIIEKKVLGRDRPYLQRVEHEPLSFSLSFALEDWGNTYEIDYIRRIARWLFKDYYRPLIFDSNPNRIFYAMVEGDSTLFHNGAKEGYIELNIRCDSPFSYSPEYTLLNTEFRNSNTPINIIDSGSSFNDGTHSNTKVTSNGMTIDSVVDTWGTLYMNQQKWGEIH